MTNEAPPEALGTDNSSKEEEFDSKAFDRGVKAKKREALIKSEKIKINRSKQEDGSFLEKSSSLYQVIDHILDKFKETIPGLKAEVVLSTLEELEACTLVGGEVIYLSVGLIKSIDQFLKLKGGKVSVDHIAFIIAHELSHWDPAAETFHINETYCDTNGLFLHSRAGFSSAAAVEVLEFLDFNADEQPEAETDDEQKDTTISLPITHPTPESRFLLGITILNNPDIYLAGRYVEQTPLDDQLVSDLLSQTEKMHLQHEALRRISSTEDIEQRINSCTSLSQLFEVTSGLNEYYEVEAVRQLIKDPKFLDSLTELILYQACIEKFHINNQTLERQDLEKALALASNTPANIHLPNARFSFEIASHYKQGREIFPDLMEKIRKGQIENSFNILSMTTEELEKVYYDLRKVKFNSWYRELHLSLEQVNKEHKAGTHLFPLSEFPLDSLLTKDNEDISTEVANKRKSFLNLLLPVLAFKYYRSSYLVEDDIKPSLFFKNENLPCSRLNKSLLEDKLVQLGICKTELVNADLALLITEPSVKNFDFPSLSQLENPEVIKDLFSICFDQHISLGEVSNSFPKQNEDLAIGGYYENFFTFKKEFLKRMLSSERISEVLSYLESTTTSGIIGTNDWVLNDFLIEIVTKNQDLPLIIQILSLQSVANSNDFLNSLTENEHLKSDIDKISLILKALLATNTISTDQLKSFLTKYKSFELMKRFIEYIDPEKRQFFHHFFWEKMLTDDRFKSTNSPLRIVEFIRQGGVVDGLANTQYFHLQEYRTYPNPVQESVNATAFKYHWSEEEMAELTPAIGILRSYLEDSNIVISENRRGHIKNLIAIMTAANVGLKPLDMSSKSINEFCKNANTESELLSVLEQLPASDVRDNYIDLILFHTNKRGLNGFTKEESEPLRKCFAMFTSKRLHNVDFDQPNTGFGNVDLIFLSLNDDIAQLAEQFPFRGTGAFSYSSLFLKETLQVLAQAHEQECQDKGVLLKESIQKTAQLIPEACCMRDYLIERLLYKSISSESGDFTFDTAMTAYELAFGDRTKSLIANSIVKELLQNLPADSPVIDKIKIITNFFPNATHDRDALIIKVLNTSRTTWDELRQAEVLLLGSDYSTTRKDARNRSIALEGVTFAIQKMDQQERAELMSSLFNSDKHVLSKSDLTKKYFDKYVRAKLRKLVLDENSYGKDKFTEQEYEQNEDALIDLILASLESTKTIKTTESENSFSDNYTTYLPLPQKFIDTFRYKFSGDRGAQLVLSWAFPESIRKSSKIFTSGSGFANSSIGPAFLQSDSESRRELLYRVLLGNKGLFSDKNFDTFGVEALNELVDSVTRSMDTMSPEHISNSKEIVITFFQNIPASLRTEIFFKFSDLLVKNGVKLTYQELINFALQSLGLVGAKLAQMDSLMPPDLIEALAGFKNELSPMPKMVVKTILDNAGRSKEYAALGPFEGAASVGVVLSGELQEAQGEQISTIIKVIRPEAKTNYKEILAATIKVIEKMSSLGMIDVDPTHIFAQLETMVTEELQPRLEAFNTRALNRLSMRGNNLASMPEIIFTGEDHLEMSRANGISLREFEQLETKRMKNTTDVPDQFDSSKSRQIYATIVENFFKQAFVFGLFHSDLHQGNIFVTPEGEVTFIDAGQVGIVDSKEERKALIKFTYGLIIGSKRIISEALMQFIKQPEEKKDGRNLEDLLDSADLVNSVTKLLGKFENKGALGIYIKGIINVFPYIKQLDTVTVAKILLPYVKSEVFNFETVRFISNTLNTRVRNGFTGQSN